MRFVKPIVSLLLAFVLWTPVVSAGNQERKKDRKTVRTEQTGNGLPEKGRPGPAAAGKDAVREKAADTLRSSREKTDFLLEGMRHYNGRNLAAARENFLKMLETDPSSDAAYFYLANIALLDRDPVSGEALLKKAIALDSANYWYNELLARIYLRTDRTAEATATYEYLIGRYPKKMDLYYTLAELYMAEENVEKSEAILDKIERLAGKSEAVGLAKFNLYRIRQDWEGALKYLVEFDRDFQSARIETLIGDMYADRYRDTLAMQYYTRALEAEPSYAPAQFGQAEIFRNRREYDRYFEQVTPFFKSPYVDPQMKRDYLTQLLQAPQFIQSFKPRVDSLVSALEAAHPADSAIVMLAAAYHNEFGDQEKSKELLQKNYARNPGDFSAAFQYLTYLYYLEDWTALERDAEQALGMFPDNTDLLQLRGIAQYRNGRPEASARTYRRIESVALPRKDTLSLLTAYSMLGDLFHEMQQTGKAYAYYRKALGVDPDYNPVLNNYAYYMALENKNLKKACQMSRKTVETEPDNPTYLDTYGWILFLMDRPEEAKGYFKHAMLYGGKENADVLDHYAEVLYRLREYDLAFIYWEQAAALNPLQGIEEKMRERKAQIKK